MGFRSAPDFAIDLFKGALHAFFNPLCFFAQVLELAKVSQPGPFARRNLKLLLHRFGHELAQGNAALGGDRLRPAKQGIRYFERSLHCPILPYLWDAGSDFSLEARPVRLGARPAGAKVVHAPKRVGARSASLVVKLRSLPA